MIIKPFARSFVLFALILAVASPAFAADSKCGAKKIGSIGKAESKQFGCVSKYFAAKLDGPGLGTCLSGATSKIDADFTKAGSCTGTSTACVYNTYVCESSVQSYITANSPSDCQAGVAKAVSKFLKARMKCSSGFYKGGDSGGVTACRSEADGKLSDAITSLQTKLGQVSCITGGASALASFAATLCEIAVVADLADTPRLCESCCETQYNDGPGGRPDGSIGCSDGPVDDVDTRCGVAQQYYQSNADYTFVSATGTYCDGGHGKCVATAAEVTEPAGCCQVTMQPGNTKGCSVGPASSYLGYNHCETALGGTVSQATQCKSATCDTGMCGLVNKPDGTTCGGGHCSDGDCVP